MTSSKLANKIIEPDFETNIGLNTIPYAAIYTSSGVELIIDIFNRC